MLFGLAELMERDAEDLALLESLDTGKPIRDARAVDVPLAIGTTPLVRRGAGQDLWRGRRSPIDRLSSGRA